MTKAPSPLLGYNNNVRHKNRVFHIQTEDSGIKHPHVITHLFMDGGRILKSVKTSYAAELGTDKLGDVVRQMMKEQHKAMFRALRNGDLDPIVDDAIAASARKSDTAIAAQKAARAAEEAPPPATTRDLPREEARVEAPVPPSLTLDLDTLGDHAVKPEDLPPPPANVLAARDPNDPGTGRYRAVEEREARPPSERPSSRARPAKSERPPVSRKSERPAPKKSDRPGRVAAVREERVKRVADPRAEPPSEPKQPIPSQSSRPGSPAQPPQPSAAVRPAAIFGQARPQSSIFGEDIISDKSLDEVILSYLAEDLEEGK